MSTTVDDTDKKKRNLLYIIYIHFSTNSEKICTTGFLKSWSITYEQDVWWSYTHGNKPNMDRSVLTILVQLTAASRFPSQLSFSNLPAELLPMLTVAATFLGYTANDPNKKEERKQQVGRGKDKSLNSSTSVQRTQCLRQHAKWILTWHMDSGSSDDITNIN